MIPLKTPFLAAASVAVVALITATGCDTSTSELLTPVAETETSFEDGLDGWAVRTGPSAGGSATVRQGDASAGSSYLEIDLQNAGDVVWLERAYALDPGGEYNLTVSVDARAASGSGELVYAGRGRTLAAGDLQSQGPLPAAWTRQLMPVAVTADPQGRVWVGVGVGASTSGAGTFGLDRLGVVFTRRGEGGG